MKLATYISAGAFIFMSAFIMKKKEANKQSENLFASKWNLHKIHVDSSVLEIQGKAFIKFNGDTKSAGGNGSCNSFGSSMTISENAISLSNIFSTKMYCEQVQQQENLFLEKLRQVNRSDIKGKSLSLFKDKTVLLEFIAE